VPTDLRLQYAVAASSFWSRMTTQFPSCVFSLMDLMAWVRPIKGPTSQGEWHGNDMEMTW
jgi:hypothetical protein